MKKLTVLILHRKRAGFVESRLRKLVSDGLARNLPIKKIQLWPKKFQVCIADKNALLTTAQRQNCLTYFIGYQIDPYRMRGSDLNVEIPLHSFREFELSRFQPLISGMDILVKSFYVKELPLLCFEDVGGKLLAMKKRRHIRDSDPARIERRRQKRLKDLKEQMEEKLKRQQMKKRKRSSDDAEEDEVNAVKLEEEQDITLAESKVVKEETPQVEEEEANLLENALDAMQDGAVKANIAKTREEAEADRQRLLAGEILEEEEGGGFEADSDEEAGYIGDGARVTSFVVKKKPTHKDKRSLPLSEQETEILKNLGYSIVSDDECKILGANMVPPWRSNIVSQEALPKPRNISAKLHFRKNFDVVELDANGHVIDKGDEDFSPSKEWAGRKAGFEFKMGERGLGYYRTGKKVVVPSNTAY